MLKPKFEKTTVRNDPLDCVEEVEAGSHIRQEALKFRLAERAGAGSDLISDQMMKPILCSH